MLAEHFVAAASSPPKLASSQLTVLKDAGIFHHSFQPHPSLRKTFKKSAAAANCMALNETHIFVAQSEKAVVHVYNREKGNQEATVPFPQRLRSLCLTADGTILVLGTEDGGLLIWEICTGRQISTAQSHLHAVSALTHDATSNFFLSGSVDSIIHVWSLLDLLSFSPTASLLQNDPITPIRTLSGHRGPINSLVAGHSFTSVDIAVSASQDGTAMIWNYRTGVRLRTILLSSIPLCLTLDPADRGLYVGLDDGSIQLVDFVDLQSTSATHVQDSLPVWTPFQPNQAERMYATTSAAGLGPTLSISPSYDGMTLLTGHASGKILSWDIGRRSLNNIVAEYSGAPITNLCFLPPIGFPYQHAARRIQAVIVKPRPHEDFSGSRGGDLTGVYSFSTQLVEGFERPSFDVGNAHHSSDFAHSLRPVSLYDEVIEDCIADLSRSNATAGEIAYTSQTQAISALDGTPDFVSLTASSSDTLKEEMTHLRDQVSHLRKMQAASNNRVGQLVREKQQMKGQEERRRERKRQRRLEVEQATDRERWDMTPRKASELKVHKETRTNGFGNDGSDYESEDEGSSENDEDANLSNVPS